MTRRRWLYVIPFATALLLAACKETPAPDQDKSPASPVGATDLRDTIQRPINKAKGVEDIIMKSKNKQDQQLQNQESGDASPASQ